MEEEDNKTERKKQQEKDLAKTLDQARLAIQGDSRRQCLLLSRKLDQELNELAFAVSCILRVYIDDEELTSLQKWWNAMIGLKIIQNMPPPDNTERALSRRMAGAGRIWVGRGPR